MKSGIRKLTFGIVFLHSLFLGMTPVLAAKQVASPIVKKVARPQVAPKPAKKENAQSFDDVVKDSTKLEGLFTLYRNQEKGKLYLEISPQQLNKNYLGTVTLASGIGESGLYRGTPLQDFLFYFRRVNNNLHFVVRNVKFRTRAGEPEQRSLDRSFTDSVLYSLNIVSINPQRQTLLIDLSELLLSDFAGLTPTLNKLLDASYQLDEKKSYFGTTKAFPLNVEVDSIYGFSSAKGGDLSTVPDSRALTLGVHYSFSQLPEKNAYIPRLADDRVGYFITAYQEFTNNKSKEPFIRYINRWQLEKQNPNAPLSPPKKPIVFWIENAVPLEYRDAIEDGILMWNKAFEKAGFQNAIEVRQMPDNADWDAADVRYNTIRWFNSVDGFFARGPSRVNPLTGQILDADIVVDANLVRAVKQEYRTVVESNPSKSDGLSSKFKDSCGKSLLGNRNSAASNLEEFIEENDLCYGMESAQQATMGSMALSLLHDITPNSVPMKEYVNQFLRSLIAHEVGHTLGLRHNFHASTMLKPEELNNPEITRTKGLVSSVMDYVPVNLAPQGVKQGDYFPTIVGPYDEWAIEYGYKPSGAIIPQAEKRFLEDIAKLSSRPELAYATDEDSLDINPNVNRWDMSANNLIYSQWQMENARAMWSRIEKRYPLQGESYSEMRLLFNIILNHYSNNAELLTQYVGGQSFNRSHAGDGNKIQPFQPVTLEKQRQALTTLQQYIFAEDAFRFSPELLNQLAPSRWGHWGSRIPVFRLDYPIHDRILLLQSGILRSLLDGDRLTRLRDLELKTAPGQALTLPELFDSLQTSIWTEVVKDGEVKQISSIRRSLQREYLDVLLGMVLRKNNVPEDARTLAWYELRQLRKSLDSSLKSRGKNADTYTKAHLEETRDRISKALDAQLQSN